MSILAEIGDKLFTPLELLKFSIPLAVFGTSLGTVSRWLLIPVLALAAFPNWMLWDEYVSGNIFGQAVINEMGYCWIAASFCAWNAPFYLGAATILWAHKRQVLKSRRANKQCLNCGYSLKGNVSGVCSECGAAVPGRDSAKPGDGVD